MTTLASPLRILLHSSKRSPGLSREWITAATGPNLALNQEKIGRADEARANYEIALSLDGDIAFDRERLAALQSAG